MYVVFFFFSSRRRHTRWPRDWSSDVCSSDLVVISPDPLHPEDLGIELLRPIEILDRDREVQNAFGLQHSSLLPFLAWRLSFNIPAADTSWRFRGAARTT